MNALGLRVLITVDAVGGVWQYGLDLARGLVARGAEPILAVLGPDPDAAQARDARGIGGLTLLPTGMPLDWLSDGPEPIVAAAAEMADLAREVRADVAQLNMPTLAVAPMPIPTIAMTHGCVATWWEAAKPAEPLAPPFHWHRDLTGAGLLAADRVVAPSASYAATIRRHYGLKRAPTVVHNGRTPLPAMNDRCPSPPPVLTVGRLWDRVKGADLLDRVAARIAVPFEAAGARVGPHGEGADLRHLQLLGTLDEAGLAQRLRERPVFVSAASFEPFGLAVLEAAQAGCPLVLSNIDTFRELWDGAALFVACGDEDGYVVAIERCLANPALHEKLGEAARQRAARYTPQGMADAMIAIYAEMLAQPQRGRAAA